MNINSLNRRWPQPNELWLRRDLGKVKITEIDPQSNRPLKTQLYNDWGTGARHLSGAMFPNTSDESDLTTYLRSL